MKNITILRYSFDLSIESLSSSGVGGVVLVKEDMDLLKLDLDFGRREGGDMRSESEPSIFSGESLENLTTGIIYVFCFSFLVHLPLN